MRLLSFIAVACVFVLSTASSVTAEPITVIEEHWAQGWDTSEGSGREHDEPLNFANHLAGPTSEAGLNATDTTKEFISASGYVFTGKYGDQPWAFTLKSPEADSLDFTQGNDDLSFSLRNNSSDARFRILLKDSGDDYFVSNEEFTSDATDSFNTVTCNFDTLTWNSFVIPDLSGGWSTTGWSMGTTATPDLSSIAEVGFATLVNNNSMRIDDIVAEAVPVPEPHAVTLLFVALLGAAWLRGNGRT